MTTPSRDSIPPLTVAALYRFTRFDDPAALQAPLEGVCRANGVRGTLLLAGGEVGVKAVFIRGPRL